MAAAAAQAAAAAADWRNVVPDAEERSFVTTKLVGGAQTLEYGTAPAPKPKPGAAPAPQAAPPTITPERQLAIDAACKRIADFRATLPLPAATGGNNSNQGAKWAGTWWTRGTAMRELKPPKATKKDPTPADPRTDEQKAGYDSAVSYDAWLRGVGTATGTRALPAAGEDTAPVPGLAQGPPLPRHRRAGGRHGLDQRLRQADRDLGRRAGRHVRGRAGRVEARRRVDPCGRRPQRRHRGHAPAPRRRHRLRDQRRGRGRVRGLRSGRQAQVPRRQRAAPDQGRQPAADAPHEHLARRPAGRRRRHRGRAGGARRPGRRDAPRGHAPRRLRRPEAASSSAGTTRATSAARSRRSARPGPTTR